MLRLTCLNCKSDVVVNPYLYEPRIITSEEFLTHEKTYTAKVRGEATCPACGNHIYETFTSPIYIKDIIDLALRKETHV